MPQKNDPADIPVILIYNVNQEWTENEKDEVINLSFKLGHALIEEAHPTLFVPIYDDDIKSYLAAFNPME